jgi:hypothetical protein
MSTSIRGSKRTDCPTGSGFGATRSRKLPVSPLKVISTAEMAISTGPILSIAILYCNVAKQLNSWSFGAHVTSKREPKLSPKSRLTLPDVSITTCWSIVDSFSNSAQSILLGRISPFCVFTVNMAPGDTGFGSV